MSQQRKDGFYATDFVENSFSPQPWPLYDGAHLLQLMAQPSVACDIANVRRGVEEAKRYLPAVVWGGHFLHQRRRQTECQSSGLFCSDIDHIADSPEGARRYYDEHFGGREDELGIVFAHVSPSGTGLHVVCLCQPGFASIAENQAWLAEQTASQYDPVCKDIGRIYYFSTLNDIIYNDLNQ